MCAVHVAKNRMCVYRCALEIEEKSSKNNMHTHTHSGSVMLIDYSLFTPEHILASAAATATNKNDSSNEELSKIKW